MLTSFAYDIIHNREWAYSIVKLPHQWSVWFERWVIVGKRKRIAVEGTRAVTPFTEICHGTLVTRWHVWTVCSSCCYISVPLQALRVVGGLNWLTGIWTMSLWSTPSSPPTINIEPFRYTIAWPILWMLGMSTWVHVWQAVSAMSNQYHISAKYL